MRAFSRALCLISLVAATGCTSAKREESVWFEYVRTADAGGKESAELIVYPLDQAPVNGSGRGPVFEYSKRVRGGLTRIQVSGTTERSKLPDLLKKCDSAPMTLTEGKRKVTAEEIDRIVRLAEWRSNPERHDEWLLRILDTMWPF